MNTNVFRIVEYVSLIISVIDLFDGQQHSEDLKSINGYSNVRKLTGRSLI